MIGCQEHFGKFCLCDRSFWAKGPIWVAVYPTFSYSGFDLFLCPVSLYVREGAVRRHCSGSREQQRGDECAAKQVLE